MLRVIVTGASSGIGAALARHYARQGALLLHVFLGTAKLQDPD